MKKNQWSVISLKTKKQSVSRKKYSEHCQKLQTGQKFLNKNIDKFWYTPTMEQQQKVQTNTSTWMNFKYIMLRERSQSQNVHALYADEIKEQATIK